MTVKQFLCFTAVLILLLSITACGSSPDDDSNTTVPTGTSVIPDGGTTPAPGEEAKSEKRTLTLSTTYVIPDLQAVFNRYRSSHRDVDLVVSDYGTDYEKFQQVIPVQLMAGDATDLIDISNYYDTQGLFDSGFLTDLYPLMQNDPAFNEDDYYMNVITGAAYQGKLLSLPLNFVYGLVGVNNAFSAELAERFSRYETITDRQIFDLYSSLPDRGGLRLYKDCSALLVIYESCKSYIDLENRTCDFNNPAFISLLRDVQKNLSTPDKNTEASVKFSIIEKQEEEAKNYLFHKASNMRDSHPLFFPYTAERAFSQYIPIVNSDNEITYGTFDQYSISESSDNKDLAWEFIQYLTTQDAHFIHLQMAFPVRRELFQSYVADDLRQAVEYRRSFDEIDGETDEIVGEVMAVFEQYNEMPMRYRAASVQIENLVTEVFENFENGAKSAEQAAAELQNKMSLYLMEMKDN